MHWDTRGKRSLLGWAIERRDADGRPLGWNGKGPIGRNHPSPLIMFGRHHQDERELSSVDEVIVESSAQLFGLIGQWFPRWRVMVEKLREAVGIVEHRPYT